jgi:phosphosulfolactate phosphohydrolase-like enzyme
MAKTSEAKVCEAAFRACQDRLVELLLGSFSGRYLQEQELIADVEHAAQLNLYDIVPVVRNGRIEKAVV